MKRLLEQCKYYKGEKDCPDNLKKAGKVILWYYESVWVETYGKIDYSWDYHHAGLDGFSQDDGVPFSLKQLLFNRYIQDSSLALSVEPFKEWYLTRYLPGV